MVKPPHVYAFDSAIVRRPAASVVNGLRAVDRGAPTLAGIEAEHDAYVDALRAAGAAVTVLPPLEAFPDAIFVEDPALVFTDGAILLRPGAPSRLGEVAEIAPTLRTLFARVIELREGFADGGDVLVTPAAVMIGLSARTDRTGAAALGRCLAELGLESRVVETPAGVLHLKTDCSLLDDETVFTTARLSASGIFRGLREVIVPEGEEAAANALRVNDVVLVSADHPRSADLLEARGYRVVRLALGEIGRIDAGASCMSLRWWRGGR